MSTLAAVLDADVLVPILSCDLLLSAFDEDLYRPRPSSSTPVALRGRVAQVAAALSHHTHDEGDISGAAAATVNHKDRHVVGAALAHGADLTVSNDRRLRREIAAELRLRLG